MLEEIHRVPDLLSYLQVVADEERRSGLFVLTGSAQFDLTGAVGGSLAGFDGPAPDPAAGLAAGFGNRWVWPRAR